MEFFKELEGFSHYVEKSTDTLRRIIDANDPSVYAESDGLEGVRKQLADLEEEISDLKQTDYNNDDIMDQFERAFSENESILQGIESTLRKDHLVTMPTLPSMLPQPGSAATSPRDTIEDTMFKENVGEGKVTVAVNAKALEVSVIGKSEETAVTKSETVVTDACLGPVSPTESDTSTIAFSLSPAPGSANPGVLQTPVTKLKVKEPESAQSTGSECATPTLADFGISRSGMSFLDKPRTGTNNKRLSTESTTSNTSTDTATLLQSPSEATELLQDGHSIASSPTLFSPPPANLTRSSKLMLSTVKKSNPNGLEEEMFPLMAPITNAEVEAAPKYLRSQIDAEKLNDIVSQLNEIVANKRSDGCPDDLIELAMLEDELSLGRMAKVIILILIKLKRLATVHVSGKTFYKILNESS